MNTEKVEENLQFNQSDQPLIEEEEGEVEKENSVTISEPDKFIEIKNF